MFDFAAICRGRTSFGSHCLPSDVHFECYLSWPDHLGFLKFLLRSPFWMLFVVFRNILKFYCLPSMLVFDAICRGRTWSVFSCFPSEDHFECYLSWPEVLLKGTTGGRICNFWYFAMILRLMCKILYFFKYFTYDFKIPV